MTPKQKYDERKRLRAERMLREEQRSASRLNQQEDADARFEFLMASIERIASVMELWADQQH